MTEWRVGWRGKRAVGKTSQEATAVVQVKEDDCLDEGSGQGEGEVDRQSPGAVWRESQQDGGRGVGRKMRREKRESKGGDRKTIS